MPLILLHQALQEDLGHKDVLMSREVDAEDVAMEQALVLRSVLEVRFQHPRVHSYGQEILDATPYRLKFVAVVLLSKASAYSFCGLPE
jgi:hypothetical protein